MIIKINSDLPIGQKSKKDIPCLSKNSQWKKLLQILCMKLLSLLMEYHLNQFTFQLNKSMIDYWLDVHLHSESLMLLLLALKVLELMEHMKDGKMSLPQKLLIHHLEPIKFKPLSDNLTCNTTSLPFPFILKNYQLNSWLTQENISNLIPDLVQVIVLDTESVIPSLEYVNVTSPILLLLIVEVLLLLNV